MSQARMDVGAIAMSALTAAGVFGLLGGILGSVVGFGKERQRLRRKQAVRVALPASVEAVDALREPLLTLADARRADVETLARVGRRCGAVLDMYAAVAGAEPASVRLSLMATGRQEEAAVKRYLYDFYKSSGVATVYTNGQLEPVNRDMRAAHEALLATIDGIVHALQLLIKSKVEQRTA